MTRPTLLLLVLPLLVGGCMQCPYDARRTRENSVAPNYVPPDKSVNVSPPMR